MCKAGILNTCFKNGWSVYIELECEIEPLYKT